MRVINLVRIEGAAGARYFASQRDAEPTIAALLRLGPVAVQPMQIRPTGHAIANLINHALGDKHA